MCRGVGRTAAGEEEVEGVKTQEIEGDSSICSCSTRCNLPYLTPWCSFSQVDFSVGVQSFTVARFKCETVNKRPARTGSSRLYELFPQLGVLQCAHTQARTSTRGQELGF